MLYSIEMCFFAFALALRSIAWSTVHDRIQNMIRSASLYVHGASMATGHNKRMNEWTNASRLTAEMLRGTTASNELHRQSNIRPNNNHKIGHTFPHRTHTTLRLIRTRKRENSRIKSWKLREKTILWKWGAPRCTTLHIKRDEIILDTYFDVIFYRLDVDEQRRRMREREERSLMSFLLLLTVDSLILSMHRTIWNAKHCTHTHTHMSCVSVYGNEYAHTSPASVHSLFGPHTFGIRLLLCHSPREASHWMQFIINILCIKVTHLNRRQHLSIGVTSARCSCTSAVAGSFDSFRHLLLFIVDDGRRRRGCNSPCVAQGTTMKTLYYSRIVLYLFSLVSTWCCTRVKEKENNDQSHSVRFDLTCPSPEHSHTLIHTLYKETTTIKNLIEWWMNDKRWR